MTWADRARRLISQAHNDQLGDDATLEERRQTLKTIGVSFSQGTSHGRKVWNRPTPAAGRTVQIKKVGLVPGLSHDIIDESLSLSRFL